LPSYDVVSNTYLPYLLLKHSTFDFKPIYNSIKIFDDASKKTPYFLIRKEDKLYSSYPIITGLAAVPFYAPFIMLNKVPELTYAENVIKVAFLGRITASVWASLSVLLFYLIIKKRSGGIVRPVLFALFYAFGTGTFSISAHGLWLHTLTQLIFTLVLMLLLKKEKTSKDFLFLGFLLGLNVLNRITNVAFAVTISIYVFWVYRDKFVPYVCGVLPSIIYWLSYNYIFYGSPFTEGYASRDAANVWTGNLLESIPGFFVSPARGFLFISPLLLLGFISMYKSFRNRDTLLIALAVGYILSMLMMARWYCWHGANGFGARMLVDYLSFIAYFAYLVFERLPKKYIYLLSVLIVYSIYIHTNGVFLRNARCSEENNWTFKCLKWGGN
jgi:hypothetical protein